ncbi:MAG: sirohydrochlorin cobaltochelatase [Proteobacteria bacterium]|nr:sirohydrochlorin cobaltochelatase [Pseudomonadota bacterium]
MPISMSKNNIPIILTAFGTTARAFSTYDRMDRIFRQRFPDHPLHWAYSSRMVRHAMNNKKKLKDPVETARSLAQKGYEWVVIQSLHLICGHEFDRLVTQRDQAPIRSSMGLPLLTSQKDYAAVANALAPLFPRQTDQALILVGHGTDHPAWTAYPALESILRQHHGDRVFLGVVEGYPGMDHTLDRIKAAGFNRVCLIPFMLVAGVHFREDLTCEPDSWQKTFEREGIEVSVVNQGIGHMEDVTSIFCDHISDALDVIPF